VVIIKRSNSIYTFVQGGGERRGGEWKHKNVKIKYKNVKHLKIKYL